MFEERLKNISTIVDGEQLSFMGAVVHKSCGVINK